MMTFFPGDIVRLKSGGPNMTVVGVGDQVVEVQWFTEEGVMASRCMAVALEPVSGKETMGKAKAYLERGDAMGWMDAAAEATIDAGQGPIARKIKAELRDRSPTHAELAEDALASGAAWEAVRDASSPRLANAVESLIRALIDETRREAYSPVPSTLVRSARSWPQSVE